MDDIWPMSSDSTEDREGLTHCPNLNIKSWYHTSRAGQAGGGSFRSKKNYIAKKKFAYRMWARRPTSAMPKRFLCCSMVVMWPVGCHEVACGVTFSNVVSCDVMWCNAMSCDVRSCDECTSVVPCSGMERCELKKPLVVRSRCVVRSGSKWFCDNVVIQSTILCYKVLLQYYSVLQSTTPVLRTTLYCSRTTPVILCTTKYYNVRLQYYSVLQSTTPVLLCTTTYYSSTTLYYKVLRHSTPVLLCATKYCKVHNALLQYYSVLQSTTLYYKVLQHTTPVLLCTTKHHSSTTLYYKELLQYYSLLQSTTPVLLCTTKYYAVLLQYYSVLPCTTPVLLCNTKVLLQYYAVLQSNAHDWSSSQMKRRLHCAEQQVSPSNLTTYCACHAKSRSWLILLTYETSFYNARGNRCRPPT